MAQSLDGNGNGQIELPELVRGMGVQVKLDLSRARVIFDYRYGWGVRLILSSISWTLSECSIRMASKRACFTKSCSIITVFFSGYISCPELRKVLTEVGQMPLSLEEVSIFLEA